MTSQSGRLLGKQVVTFPLLVPAIVPVEDVHSSLSLSLPSLFTNLPSLCVYACLYELETEEERERGGGGGTERESTSPMTMWPLI